VNAYALEDIPELGCSAVAMVLLIVSQAGVLPERSYVALQAD
jgi:hypothetical protein